MWEELLEKIRIVLLGDIRMTPTQSEDPSAGYVGRDFCRDFYLLDSAD